jgi:hypothetical protein
VNGYDDDDKQYVDNNFEGAVVSFFVVLFRHLQEGAKEKHDSR